ncbi:hypothetical protein [Streptomyces sp. NPDC059994]|uniref:DUF7848 domain-containing protein n=1 Tax=Streptomyces sp. NPDC059994 TaxID=3347029 RepID=UPI0036AF1F46
MSPRSVIRAAEWTLGPDRGDDTPPITIQLRCTSCHDPSPEMPVLERGAAEQWALEHAGISGHTGFRETAVAHLLAIPAEGNPRGREATDG